MSQRPTDEERLSAALSRAQSAESSRDALARERDEAMRLMDEAGLPGTSGPLDQQMDLVERVRMVIALPQRRKHEEKVAALARRVEGMAEALREARDVLATIHARHVGFAPLGLILVRASREERDRFRAARKQIDAALALPTPADGAGKADAP